MAVKRLADAFPHHRQQVLGIFITFVVVISLFLGFLLYAVGTDILLVLMVTTAVGLIMSLGVVLLVNFALEPLDYLSSLITHLSNEPNSASLPNLTGTRHEKTGYKQMLDTIYQLLARDMEAEDDSPHTATERSILDRIPAGIIALNENREVVFSNAKAPVVNQDNTTSVQLIFEGEDTLNSWLTHVEESKVGAEKIWPRIQNVLPGQPDRKLYDVLASYEKHGTNNIDTLLVTLDKTNDYAVDEENMDFIALAAHELRGPVTVIHGYLDILRRELSLTKKQNALFDRLEVSTSRLSGYISNILNASKYDRRHLKLHLYEENLSNIYKLIADDIELRAKTQNRLLSVNIPDDLPDIAADKNSLGEVLANFIDNAIKYSNEGGHVDVKADLDGSFVRVQVTDKGIGIPAAIIGNLFSKFYRSHRSRARVSGTGLGLYISKAIIESHGGHVSVSSKEGAGSTFSFSVPTYDSVKDKLLAHRNENKGIIETGSGWIKNHAAYRN